MLRDMASDPGPAAIVVMGVSGSGKTLVGRRLAERLGWRFLGADDLHPPGHVAKMRSGRPLDDADRGPWLDLVAAAIDAAVSRGEPVVVACSALRRAHRQRLGLPRASVRLVHLTAPADVIRKRIEQRVGHFMPATLLDSQLATLEPPGPAESPIVVDVSAEPQEVLRLVEAALGLP